MSRFVKGAALTALTGTVLLGAAGIAAADSQAEGAAIGSPGVASGNVVQVPIHVPINICGNTTNIIFGILNPTFGNTCINADSKRHSHFEGEERSIRSVRVERGGHEHGERDDHGDRGYENNHGDHDENNNNHDEDNDD